MKQVMGLSGKSYEVSANSLLESVVALSIISICLYIAAMVYASVFTVKTSARFYLSNNKADEAFFLLQIGQDSLLEKYDTDNWTIEESRDGMARELLVTYKDSVQKYPVKRYYAAE